MSWAWCRGTHTSDKPHLGSARASEAALSSLPFPLSLLSFLPQIPQGHLLAPALEHGPQNSQGMEKKFESSTEKGDSDWGRGGGHQCLLWGRGVPRALTPSPATGQGPSFTELAPIRLPNTDMNPPQPPGPSSWFPHPKPLWSSPPPGCTPTHPRLCTQTPACACPEGSALAPGPPAACPLPTPPGSPGSRSPACPAPLTPLTLLRLCTEGLGEGKEPEEGKEEVGAGQAGTGWVAGQQLAGKVVPAETTSSPA